MRRAPVIAALLLALVAPLATAQRPADPREGNPDPTTLIVRLPPHPHGQRPAPALTAEQLRRLQVARGHLESERVDHARQILAGLLREVPHHPHVLAEMARVHIARQEFAALERLARAERFSQKDSVLLGRELALALERLGRPREAARVALEAWSVEPAEGEWAGATVLRLAPADPRGVRLAVRRAAELRPERLDLVRALAQLEWGLGDAKAMLRALASGDRAGIGPPLRWGFADELIRRGTARDSAGAVDVLLDLAADTAHELPYRTMAARRAWELARSREGEADAAPRLVAALKDVPPMKWNPELLAEVVRGLRRGGRTDDARALLEAHGEGGLPPALALEQALADLRDGLPERALPALAGVSAISPEAEFRYAEALFFTGQADSALTVYQRIAERPDHAHAGAALERIYLIEDAAPRAALPVFGRIAHESWRGNEKRATALADSLYRALPRSPLWAQAALTLSRRLEAEGNARAALAPLLAVADSLPGDRLAPLARQRAGDILAARLGDHAAALVQYEECLVRYPRAWNAPEVRRSLEALRRARRF